MILSQATIKKYLKEGAVLIDPLIPSNFKEASYTFTLDARLKLLKHSAIERGQIVSAHDEVTIKEHGYNLRPGSFVVGFTKEKISLPDDICCFLATRASVAQMGIDALQSSTFVEPGSDHQLRLEIRNNGPIPITLLPGMLIVKAIFATVS